MLTVESGRFFFYPLHVHKAIAALSSPLQEYRFAASPLPNLHHYPKVLSECVAGWSPTDCLEQVDFFYENEAYVQVMHNVLKRWAHLDGSVVLRARAVGTGWVHVCDERGLPCLRYPTWL